MAVSLCGVVSGFLLLLYFGPQIAGTVSTLESVRDPEKRAEITLEGFFHYFWKHDQRYKNIQFFFSCAQIGGDGTPKEGQCRCDKPSSCVHCYRWWMAVALESVATYGMYMNTTNHSSVSDMLYDHSPYNAEWNATAACTYIDDFLWYGIAYLRVYEWLGDKKWLDRSISLHDWAWEYGWDEPCGGFWWSSCDGRKFKDNIELVEALHLAAKLAYLLPNNSRFLSDAERIWNWFISYDNGKGLLSSTNLVSTGVVPENCCNSSSNSNAYKTCHNTQLHGTAYNNGLFLSSLAYLYLSTGNEKYLNIGLRSVEAVLANYTTKEGILIDEPRSYQSYSYTCSVGSDPGGDWYSFNGIFMLHLGYFTELLVKNGTMPSDVLQKINLFTQKTSDSAWLKSAVWPPFDNSNACQIGSNSDVNTTEYPKFHWWWGGKEVDQIIPPDPKLFFHINNLHCASIGRNSQIWKGDVASEDKCKEKCDNNTKCSKYNWLVYELPNEDHNCWLWSFNRSSHLCNHTDLNWNVGFKRPKGQVSCVGRCGSTEPQELDDGVCYCDASCSKHLDCCLDYADQCHPQQPVSCKGYCGTPTAQPILGGGYCWCNFGCDGWYTDNNSDGSCCPDYPMLCNSIAIPQCLDARSQGSALNLFIGHISVTRMMDKYFRD